MNWEDTGAEIAPSVPPFPPRSTLIEMAVGHLCARRQVIPTSPDELENVGKRLHADNFRAQVLREMLHAKKVQRVLREADNVYVYTVHGELVCVVDATEAVSDDLLAKIGLALRFGKPKCICEGFGGPPVSLDPNCPIHGKR